jgi:hypothetical protein
MKSNMQAKNIKYTLQLLSGMIKDTLTSPLFLYIVFVAGVIVLNHLGAMHSLLDVFGREHINDVNNIYLHQVKLNISESLKLLTSINSVLEVVKSSSIESTLQTEIQFNAGNIFHSFHQYIEIAISVTSVAIANTMIIEILVEVSHQISTFVLTLTIVCIAIFFLLREIWPNISRVAKNFSYALSILSFISFLGIPVTLYTTSIISKNLTYSMSKQAHQHFIDIYHQLVSEKEKNLEESILLIIKKYQTKTHDLYDKSRLLGISVMRYLVTLLLNTFLFPFGFFYLVYKAIKIALRPFFIDE